MRRPRPLLVGLFVLGAVTLAVAAVIAIGALSPFEERTRLVTYVPEPVSGLEVGSAVKVQGVLIGRVSSLAVAYDPEVGRTVTAVVYEVRSRAVVGPTGDAYDLGRREVLDLLVAKGLRAKVELQGITGVKFLGLEFVDPARRPVRVPASWEFVSGDLPIVPWIPSSLAELTDGISEIVAELKGADLPGLSGELRGLLAAARTTLEEAPTVEAVASVGAAAEELRGLAASVRASEAIESIARAADEVERLAAGLDARADALAGELTTTLEEARSALAAFRDAQRTLEAVVSGGAEIGPEAERTLARLAEAAAAVERLAEYLERNPAALLRGRAR